MIILGSRVYWNDENEGGERNENSSKFILRRQRNSGSKICENGFRIFSNFVG